MGQFPVIVIVAGVLAVVIFAFLWMRVSRTAALVFALLAALAVVYFILTSRTVESPANTPDELRAGDGLASTLLAAFGTFRLY